MGWRSETSRLPRALALAGAFLSLGVLALPTAGQDPDAEAAVRRARAALAREIAAEESALVEEGVLYARFPNAALGCPRPGEMAAAVVTPGWRVVLRHGEKRYDVRVAETGGAPRVCGEAGASAKPRPSTAVVDDVKAASRAAERARQDLARRLGKDLATVRRVWARPVRWDRERPGCEPAQFTRAGGGGRDFLVLLEQEGVEHRYRVEGDTATPCPVEDGGGG
jgi:hypothetical protein